MFICEILVVRLVFSSILHIRYVEVRISRSVSASPFDFEITRIDCMYICNCNYSKLRDVAKTRTRTTLANHGPGPEEAWNYPQAISPILREKHAVWCSLLCFSSTAIFV